MAARVCCVSAVRYGGQDREIIAKLGNDPAVCDYVVTETGTLQCTVSDEGKLFPFAQAIVDLRELEFEREWKKRNKKWWQFWR